MEQKREQSRRHGPDSLIKFVNISGIVSWVILISIFLLIGYAKPQVETFFDRRYQIKLDKNWDKDLLEYSFYLLIYLFTLCGAGLAINKTRMRRKTDKYNRSLIILGSLSGVSILIYILFYL